MPLIPAGDHARQLTSMLRDRAAVNDSGTDPLARSRLASVALQPGPAGATTALAAPAATQWQDHQPVYLFPDRPLTAAQVRSVVTNAYAADRYAWERTVPGDLAPVVMIAAERVTGLHPGLYTAGPTGAAAFEPLPGDPRFPWVSREYGEASALLLVCGDLAAACQRRGSGYGTLLVRAGALGQAAWLSAISAGLGGAVYARSSHRVTEAARPLGEGLRHLLTVAVGYRPAAATESLVHG